MKDTPFGLLVRTFVRRFFENDLLAPDLDLRPLAIWIVVLLATPGTLLPMRLALKYAYLAGLGPDVVEAASWIDKTELITISMAACGAVAILSFDALLIDRRDAFVLGTLPLEPTQIVIAKLVAVLAVFAAAAVATTAVAILLFPPAVYARGSLALVARAAAGHAVATIAAGLTTAIALAAAQVVALRFLSGRTARALAPLLQATAIAALLALLLTGGDFARAVAIEARKGGMEVGNALFWPPAWFLGLYQFVQGTRTPLFDRLAIHAALAISAAAGLAVPLILFAWRRALAAMVAEPPVAVGRRSPGRHRLARAAAREHPRPPVRALGELLCCVVARTPRHRLVTMSAAGLAAIVALQTGAHLWERSVWETRSLAEFAAPVLVLSVLLAAARWLIAVPVELPAAWVLQMAAPVPAGVVTRAVHRFLLVLVVLPATTVAALLSLWQGSAREAAVHAVLVLLLSLAAVEWTLRRLDDLPCATEYVPGRSTSRWPFYAAVLLFAVPPLAGFLRWLATSAGTATAVVVVTGAAALARAVHVRQSTDRVIDGGARPVWHADTAALHLSFTVARRAHGQPPEPLDTGPPRTETAR